MPRTRKIYDEMDDVKRIVSYARSVARRPDDGVATTDMMLTAKNNATDDISPDT